MPPEADFINTCLVCLDTSIYVHTPSVNNIDLATSRQSMQCQERLYDLHDLLKIF